MPHLRSLRRLERVVEKTKSFSDVIIEIYKLVEIPYENP